MEGWINVGCSKLAVVSRSTHNNSAYIYLPIKLFLSTSLEQALDNRERLALAGSFLAYWTLTN